MLSLSRYSKVVVTFLVLFSLHFPAKAQGSSTNYSYPYHEDFSCSGLPDGWSHYKSWLSDILNGESLVPFNAYYGNGWQNTTFQDHNVDAVVLDGNHLLNLMGNSIWLRSMVVSPSVYIESNAQLSFDLAYTNPQGNAVQYVQGNDDKFVVLISKDNMSTWTVLRQWDDAGSSYVLHNLPSSRTFVSIDLSSYAEENVNVAFYVESRNVDNNNSVFHIDNVALEPMDECEMPYSLAVSNVTKTTADLVWSSKADNWEIDVNGTVIQNVTEKSYQLTGLTPETQYTVKVRTNCGNNEVSRWSNPAIFTTAISCPTPSDLSYSGLTSHSVTLGWTENGTATEWEICLNGDEEHPVTADSNPFTIDNLTEDMKYTVKVRAVNSQTDKSHQWSNAVTFWPTDKRIIGSGTAVNVSVPTNTWFDNSMTQQIYTASEIGAAGAILNIGFYHANVALTRNLDIYIISTDKESFSGNNDWVNVTADDLYFSGSVNFAADAWTTVTLDNAFNYDGQKNVLIVIDDNTGSYWGNEGTDFLVFDAPNQSLYVHRSDIDYDPTAPPYDSYDSRRQDVKNQIRIGVGSAPAVPRPMLFAANYTGGTQVELSWHSNQTSFEINVDKTSVDGTSVNDVIQLNGVSGNSYNLTSLDYATTYTIKVRAKNGEDVSEWSSSVTFITAYCAPANMCQISFELNDKYNKGWNGAAIKVSVTDDGFILGRVTKNNGGSITTTLSVPDGHKIKFEWEGGSSDEDCSYVVKDHNGDVIFSGQYAMNGPVYYDVDCSSCAMPSGLSTTAVTKNSATLNWTGNSGKYVTRITPWTQVGNDIAAASSLTTYTFDLSGYSGTGSIAIRHYDVIGKSALLIDDILVTNSNGETVFSENFEVADKYYYSLPFGLSCINLDGDDDTWEYGRYGNTTDSNGNRSFNGNGGMDSYSWELYQGPLTPDNWLIISGVELGGSFSLVARSKDERFAGENFGVYVCPDNVFTETEVTSGTSLNISNLEEGTPYSWRVKAVDGINSSRWATTIFKTSDEHIKIFASDGNWNDAEKWSPVGVPDYNDKVRIEATVTIPAGVTAQAKKVILKTDASSAIGSIIIADGGQLKQGASSVKVTMQKNLTGGTNNLIASPIIDRAGIAFSVDADRIENLIQGTYDLYAFDPACQEEWRNGKLMGYSSSSESDLFKDGMLWGNGYYYSNNDNVTLNYIGSTKTSYQNEISEPLNYNSTCTDIFNGWKLVGNPFTCNCKISYSSATFFKLNASGDKFDMYYGYVVLAPGEGAFMKVTKSGNIIYSSEVPENPASSVGAVKIPFLPLKGLVANQDAASYKLSADGSRLSGLAADYAGHEMKVEFIRDFSKGVASTVCLPFSMTDVTGGTLYEFVDVTYNNLDGWVATMQDANIAAKPTVADKPYLFMPSKNGSVAFRGNIDIVPSSFAAGETTASHTGGDEGNWTFHGTYDNITWDSSMGVFYGFAAKSADSVNPGDFVKATNGASVPPYRCYLTYNGTSLRAQMRSLRASSEPQIPSNIKVKLLDNNGTVTAVGWIDTDSGDVTIDRWYDMNGHELDGAPMGNGMFIHNGKAVLIDNVER